MAEWSPNGTHSESAQALADRPDAEATTDPAVEGPPNADLATVPTTDESPDPALGQVGEPPIEGTAVETDSEPVPANAPAADDGSAFLSELVRAMRSTAAAERERVAADTDRRRETQLAAIEARRESEAATMRQLAATDLTAIDTWAEDERQRIQAERERRATELQGDLETSLTEHGAQVDRQIEGVEAAITTYRADVETFFAALDDETDPVAIARHASKRPIFPNLDTIVVGDAVASADQTGSSEPAEGVAVGVMEAPGSADLARSWAAWSDSETAGSLDVSAAEGDADPADDVTAEPATDATAIEAPAVGPGQGKILQTTPVSRPMSWLRRDHDGSER